MGWQTSAVGTGRSKTADPPARTSVETRLREVLPLVELRVPFEMRRAELNALDRGAKDFDTDPIIEAAREIAIAEDRAVFHGYPAAGIRGICESADAAVELSGTTTDYPSLVTNALNRLRDAGVGGPFAIALSERCYAELTEATDDGYPVLQHVRRLIDGPIVWAPGLEGALVLSMRGEDFEMTVGQDFSIGYLDHDPESRASLHRGELHVLVAVTAGRGAAGVPGRRGARLIRDDQEFTLIVTEIASSLCASQ